MLDIDVIVSDFDGTLLDDRKRLPEQFPAMMMILPVGGFLTLGVLIAVVQYFLAKREKGADDK